jgi:polyhydroxyalkanoate synthase
MEKPDALKIQELTNEMAKAGQTLAQNYITNFPEYMKTYQEFATSCLQVTSKLVSDGDSLQKTQTSYLNFLQSQMELSKRIAERQLNNEKEYTPVITPPAGDRRFSAPEWDESPYYFDFIRQNYLLISKLITEIFNSVDLDPKSKDKLNFYTKQWIDALAPSNFFITNPEAIKLAKDTNGQSVLDGFRNMLSDMQKGRISQTDSDAFEVGKNLATTKGSVVFENEIMQLIQYSPLTPKVAEFPLVILPPWINKYYILDLHTDKSLAEFAVRKGQTTFMISWKNPTPEMGYLGFEEYVEKGAIKAFEVARKISGAKKVNALGYCLGGTLLGMTLSILRSKDKIFPAAEAERNTINTSTFLATMLDFSDIGPMGAIIDEPLVKKLEGELAGGGVLKGHEMAQAFNTIRANELVWNYVSNNYLKGKNPSAFNVLYWTDDNTNLPAKMYTYYLREMLFENKLRVKNSLKLFGIPLDLGQIDLPAYIIGTIDDHIAPCRTAFVTTELLSGPVEYVLGDSGHIMGAINAPSIKNKYNFKYGGKLGEGYETWQKTATQGEGSWWIHWNTWLADKQGKQVPAPAHEGNKEFPAIEPAPGRYVKEKC